MSYKVLTDGNGSGLIRVIGLGDYMPLKDHQAMVTECEEKSKAIFDIMAERDALAAQVETLKSLFPLDCLVGCDGVLNYPIEKYNNVVDAFNSAPTQCLAELKAEAGRAGFIACAEWVGDSEYENDKMLKAADEYAAKIRNAGTWLKDSNVNGGKRQGGAE